MGTHTAKTSAAMAAPTFKRTAISLIITLFCLSAPLITNPQPLWPSSLKLSMFEIGVAAPLFHHECKILWISSIISLYFVPWTNSPLIHLHAILLSPHTVALWVLLRACAQWCLRDPNPWVPFCLTSFLHHSFLFFCVQWELHLVQDVSDEVVLVLRRVSLFSRNHPVFLTRPTCSHLIPHISSIVPHSLVLPSCAVFWIFFHHFLCVGIATMSCSSIYTLSSGRISPHSLVHCVPTPWRHILSAICSHRKGSFICTHIFLAIMLVLVWYSTRVSSFCLFKRNNFVIIFVSHL